MSKDPGPVSDVAAPDSAVERRVRDGSAYAIRRDPDYPGITQVVVRALDGATAGGRFDRDGLRLFVADVVLVGELRQVPPVIRRSDRAVVLAGAMRRNLELLRELGESDPPAAEALLQSLLADLRSWRPSLSSGMPGLVTP